MTSIIYQTENATFKFGYSDVKEHLNQHVSEGRTDEKVQILNLISIASDKTVEIPNDYHYFGYIVIELINKGKGSVTCKICQKTYQPNQLKASVLGHGKSPFSTDLKQKGGIIIGDVGSKVR